MNDIIQLPGRFSIQIRPVRGVCAAHSHDFLEFAYIRTGWTQHTLNGRSRILNAGDFVLLDFGEVHSYDVASKDLEVINCLFQPAAIDPSLRGCRSFRTLLNSGLIGVGYAYSGIREMEKLFHDDTGEIRAILQQLLEEYEQQKIGCAPLIRALLTQLIVQTVRMIRQSAPTDVGIEVSWILDEIRRDAAAPHSLNGYAKRFQMRPEALSRLFRRQSGEGFAEYLRRSRMELACRLLLETDAQVPEIAERCGYLDEKSFREAFRKVVGVSPRQYRGEAMSEFFAKKY